MAGSVPDLPGILAPEEGAREIMIDIKNLLGRRKSDFPGAQPVSFTRDHIHTLLNEDFLVCEKSDGLRCLMFLSQFLNDDGTSEERIYLITRQCEVSWVSNLHIPSEPGNSRPFQVGTLIDGELVSSNDGKIRFFMFDLLSHQGRLLKDRNLEKRLGYLEQLVFRPFASFCNSNPADCAQFDFKIYLKTMSQAYRLDSVLTQKREHLSDGLIFTSVSAPYVFGTDEHILKWKPANENSVDFSMRLDFIGSDDPDVETDYWSKPTFTLLVWAGDHDYDYSEMYLTDEEWESWKAQDRPLNYRIVEVVKDEEGRWRFLRFRDDKDRGNHISVVKKVEQSIIDAVSLEQLSEQIPKIRENWERRGNAKHGKRSREEDSAGPNQLYHHD